MPSSEFQPSVAPGPEFRPDGQPTQGPETVGRPIEAVPAAANRPPAPAVASSTVNPQLPTATQAVNRTAFDLERSTVKLPERADASRAVLINQTRQIVAETRGDPAIQKDKISQIKEAYQEIKESVGS